MTTRRRSLELDEPRQLATPSLMAADVRLPLSGDSGPLRESENPNLPRAPPPILGAIATHYRE